MTKDEAINWLRNLRDDIGKIVHQELWPYEQALVEIMEMIDDLPSAERKNGRWINHRNDNGHNIADCSECGNAIQWFDDDEKPKFCCMCGADMRERKEE